MEKDAEKLLSRERLEKWIKVFLVFLAFIWLCTIVSKSIYVSRLTRVQTDTASKKYVEHIVETDGIVMTGGEIAVNAQAGLRVDRIYVRQGDAVQTGDVLFTIDLADLSEIIKAKETELARQQCNLSDLQTNAVISAQKQEIAQLWAQEDYETADIETAIAKERAKEAVDKAEAELARHLEKKVPYTNDSSRRDEWNAYNSWISRGYDISDRITAKEREIQDLEEQLAELERTGNQDGEPKVLSGAAGGPEDIQTVPDTETDSALNNPNIGNGNHADSNIAEADSDDSTNNIDDKNTNSAGDKNKTDINVNEDKTQNPSDKSDTNMNEGEAQNPSDKNGINEGGDKAQNPSDKDNINTDEEETQNPSDKNNTDKDDTNIDGEETQNPSDKNDNANQDNDNIQPPSDKDDTNKDDTSNDNPDNKDDTPPGDKNDTDTDNKDDNTNPDNDTNTSQNPETTAKKLELQNKIKQARQELTALQDELTKHGREAVKQPDYSAEELEYDAWQTTKLTLEANVQHAKENYSDVSYTREVTLRQKMRDIASAQVTTMADSTAAIYELDINQTKTQLAKLYAIQKQKGEIRAQSNGIISAIHVDVGGRTSDTAAVLMTDGQRPCQFKFSITKEQGKYIHLNDTVELKLNGQPTAMEIRVDYFTENAQGGYDAVCMLPEGVGQPGLSGTIQKTVQGEYHNLTLPVDAVFDEMGSYYIYTLHEKEGILGSEYYVEKIKVQLKDKNDRYAALESGTISADTEVVVYTTKELKQGESVRPQEK